MREDIQSLDKRFDFSAAYERNYRNLINVFFEPVTAEIRFVLDGKETAVLYEGSLYRISYRDWQNQNIFPLQDRTFWSSEQKAREWFNNNLRGLKKLSTAEAYATAEEHLKISRSM